jgi:hypothetical protein
VGNLEVNLEATAEVESLEDQEVEESLEDQEVEESLEDQEVEESLEDQEVEESLEDQEAGASLVVEEEAVVTANEISLLVSRPPSPKPTSTRCTAPAIFTQCKCHQMCLWDNADSSSINTPSGGEWAYECVDFANDLENCSGEGVNCADIPHSLSVGCDAGRCIGKSFHSSYRRANSAVYTCQAGYTRQGSSCVAPRE